MKKKVRIVKDKIRNIKAEEENKSLFCLN